MDAAAAAAERPLRPLLSLASRCGGSLVALACSLVLGLTPQLSAEAVHVAGYPHLLLRDAAPRAASADEQALAHNGSWDIEPAAQPLSDNGTIAAAPVTLVRLRRRPVRRLRNTVPMRDHRGFFVGVLTVGNPAQKFRAVFDTASGQVVLPASVCTSGTCQEHFRYAPEASSVAVDLNADGNPWKPSSKDVENATTSVSWQREAIGVELSSMGLGDGQAIGDLFDDELCLGGLLRSGLFGLTCVRAGIMAATEMADVPFRALPHDGIVGLGLSGLSIGSAFNFLGRLSQSSEGLLPRFGFGLAEETGELALGGFNHLAWASGPLLWSPVAEPDVGYWQVQLRSVWVGNQPLASCSGSRCRGLVDSGAGGLGTAKGLHGELEHVLGSRGGRLCAGPELRFQLEGGEWLTLGPEDYGEAKGPAAAGSCRSADIWVLDLPDTFDRVFIWGEPMLRRYYAAFDAETNPPRLGFAPLVGHAAVKPAASGKTVTAPVNKEGLGTSRAQLRWPSTSGIDFGEAELEALAARSLPPPGSVGGAAPVGASGAFAAQAFGLQVCIVAVMFLTMSAHARPDMMPVAMMAAQVERALVKAGLPGSATGAAFAKRLAPEERPEQGDECPICLGSCDDRDEQSLHWCRLQCGHRFHEHCVFEWFWKSSRCPVCRAHVLEKRPT